MSRIDANASTRVDVASTLAPREPAALLRANAASARPRLDHVDLLRGLVMVLMVLDHVRDYMGRGAVDPRDVHEPALFLTRWITHYCAPTFIFLAGVSSFLYGARGRTRGELSRFLLTRGLWLVLCELTIMRVAWTFTWRFEFVFLQVIWAIGWSLIALSGLVFLPRRVVAGLALFTIVGHHLLDGIKAAQFGEQGWIWVLLHEPAFLRPSPTTEVFALYPLIPWIAVMAAGYAFGPVQLLEPAMRKRRTLLTGLLLTAAFVALRWAGVYGDPAPWSRQDGALSTFLAFINCEKYPPSLCYLAMTLGPALMALALFERARGRLANVLVTFGRVPFLFYVAHAYLVHGAAVAFAWVTGHETAWLFRNLPPLIKPQDFGASLGGVYLAWIALTAALFPLCRWFAHLKQRRNDGWLSYL